MYYHNYDILLCNDNSFILNLDDLPERLLSVNGARKIALELNSLSKLGKMARWRTGMLAGSATFINDVLRFKSNMDSRMFLLVQLAAAKALSLGPGWYGQLNHPYAARREKAFHLPETIQS